MCVRNTTEDYGDIAKGFHWAMAVLIIGMLWLGLWMTGLEKGPQRSEWYGIHKSIGALILVLAVLRLGWRLINIVPVLPNDMPRLLKAGARLTHYMLYALMFAMPLTGWGMSSAGGRAVSVFGWFDLPPLVEPSEELGRWFNGLHEWLAYGLIALAALHVAAALWHHFVRHDRVLWGMLPGGRGRGELVARD